VQLEDEVVAVQRGLQIEERFSRGIQDFPCGVDVVDALLQQLALFLDGLGLLLDTLVQLAHLRVDLLDVGIDGSDVLLDFAHVALDALGLAIHGGQGVLVRLLGDGGLDGLHFVFLLGLDRRQLLRCGVDLLDQLVFGLVQLFFELADAVFRIVQIAVQQFGGFLSPAELDRQKDAVTQQQGDAGK